MSARRTKARCPGVRRTTGQRRFCPPSERSEPHEALAFYEGDLDHFGQETRGLSRNMFMARRGSTSYRLQGTRANRQRAPGITGRPQLRPNERRVPVSRARRTRKCQRREKSSNTCAHGREGWRCNGYGWVRRHRAASQRPRCSILPMQLTTGTVVGGKIVVEGDPLPEGTVVTILARETDETFAVPPELEGELLESIAEADRGETISADELLSRLRRNS